MSENNLSSQQKELGYSSFPLCKEPWESYYILRRGIMPCCYGNPIVAPMSGWDKTWNSPEMQEIREYLSRGELSPYCLESLGCPIVQRELAKIDESHETFSKTPVLLRRINKIFFGLPKKIYELIKRKSE